MTITELMADLELLKEAFGDLPVMFMHKNGDNQLIQAAGVAGPDDDLFIYLD